MKTLVVTLAAVALLAGCYNTVSAPTLAVRESCMIDDMEEIIASRQTVEFSLTTSRITGEARVTISGPGYRIDLDGFPGDWSALLAAAIKDWREVTQPK